MIFRLFLEFNPNKRLDDPRLFPDQLLLLTRSDQGIRVTLVYFSQNIQNMRLNIVRYFGLLLVEKRSGR